MGFYQFMNRHGRRSSAAYAFLSPLEGDPRLTLRLQARAERILIENGRALGVLWRDKAGTEHRSYARGEIIVTAGALVSLNLLMLSGVGPADHLAQHGIPVVADLPGVGRNLIDHPEVPIIATANGSYGYFRQGVGWRMLQPGCFRRFGGLRTGSDRQDRTVARQDPPGGLIWQGPGSRIPRPAALRVQRLAAWLAAFLERNRA